MRIILTAALALTGAAAAFGTVALADHAIDLPHAEAAETVAVPLVATAALAGTCLFCAAVGATTIGRD